MTIFNSKPLLLKLYVKLAQSESDVYFVGALLLFELCLCVFIIHLIPYTEIDWSAYMSQVTQYQAGERNYYNIRGGTGPLVYPAGFLYLYSWLKTLTTVDGIKIFSASTTDSSIYMGQLIFIGFYMFQLTIVLWIYSLVARNYSNNLLVSLTKKEKVKEEVAYVTVANSVWSWRLAMLLCCLSKRIHSIYILRLFNDGPAMMLLYASVIFFIYGKWKVGCIVYSMAVSIKMNVLLFAPGLLLLLLQSQSNLLGTIQCLSICAIVQVMIGWPFLVTYPIAYIRKSFELDRVFMHQWTVNWKVRLDICSLIVVLVYSLPPPL
jgi:alpha-1,3-mannosyltransferase